MLRIFLFLGSALFAAVVGADNHLSFKTTEVAPGIFMLEGVGGFTGGNIGLLTGPDGEVLIDNGIQPLTKLVNKTIRKQVSDGVDYVVNTHAHGDHIGGNQALSQSGAAIVGHEKLRARLQKDGISAPGGKIEATDQWLPEITYSDKMSLHLNGHHIRIFHMPNAHTDGDSVVYFPDADVIHAGDLFFNGLFPYIDGESGGSVDGYIAAQQRLLVLATDDTKIIPGHGPLATKDDLESALAMLIDSRDRVRKLVAAGKTADEIVAINPLADYHDGWNWGFITTEVMTRQLVTDAGS